MKISLEWLSDYIAIDRCAREIADILSNLGFDYESICDVGADTVIDIEVTSNRSDCLSYIGVARELAVGTGAELKIPEGEPAESGKKTAELAAVEIAEPALCGRYTARVIEGVKVGPSPEWLQGRLEAAGVRSVNNVVDATNYAMLETGQPAHAFDYDKIAEHKIIVRRALAGERLMSIDRTKCDLNPEMLVIADAVRPVAIAGVMGGLDTEVSEGTKNVLLEDAHFDAVSVRTTSRRLALPSEAAFRFERDVDIEQVERASRRTAELIIQVAGGKAARGVVDVYPGKPQPAKPSLRLSRLKKLLGIEVPSEKTVEILKRLGFQPVQDGDTVKCSVPSWRRDVKREVDLIEEVARIYGYDKVPGRGKIVIEAKRPDRRQKLVDCVTGFLDGCGFYETINVAFTDKKTAGLVTGADAKDFLSVTDETRRSVDLLRPSLIGSLLAVFRSNVYAGNLPCRLYELAGTFQPYVEGKLPIEKSKLGLVCDGEFRFLRGVIEGIVKGLNRDAGIEFNPTQFPWAAAAAEIMVNGQAVGSVGVVSSSTVEHFSLKGTSPCAAELDFEALAELEPGEVKMKPIPRYPGIRRDLSLVVAEDVLWRDIATAIQSGAPSELQDVEFGGIYRGKGIGRGEKSVTVALHFRDEQGTLTHEQVDEFQSATLEQLKRATGARLRGS